MRANPILFQWNQRDLSERYRTGVSIHSHTLHSKESLDFIYAAARHSSALRYAIREGEERYRRAHGRVLDFRRGWWTPPLAPLDAHKLESGALSKLGFGRTLVSITDHDDIEAPMSLQAVDGSLQVPVSVEWTIPYGPTFFHFGVHNLPAGQARLWMARLAQYTKDPDPNELRGIFEDLHSTPGVLVVFNHPLWDEKGIGRDIHRAQALDLFGKHGAFIHAAELNGLRPWKENRAVIQLAREWSKPAISGGDRHTIEPNATLNVTQAITFGEFVDEIRAGESAVLIASHYREPHAMRIFHNLLDVFRRYENHGRGWIDWSDRVFYEMEDGCPVSLKEHFGASSPLAVRIFAGFMQFACDRRVNGAIRSFARPEQVML